MGFTEGFLDYSSGLKIRYRINKHNNRPILVYVHGITGKLDFYNYMYPYFDNNGISLNAVELRGCGVSGDSINNVSHINDFVTDLKRFIYGNLQNRPVYLMGSSLGALVAVNTALDERFHVKGVILLSPAFFLKQSPVIKFISRLLGFITPGLRLKLRKEYFDKTTHDSQWSETLYKEALTKGNITFGFVKKTMRANKKLLKEIHLLKEKPLLVLTGADDPLIDNNRLKVFFDELYQDVKHDIGHLTMLEFKKCSHAILLEKGRLDYIHKIIDWIHKVELVTPHKD